MLAWSCKFNFLVFLQYFTCSVFYLFYLLWLFRKYWFHHLQIKDLSFHHWATSSIYFFHPKKDWIYGKKGKLVHWPLNKEYSVPQVFAHMEEGLVFNSIKQNLAHMSKHANTEQPRNVTRTKTVCCVGVTTLYLTRSKYEILSLPSCFN